MDRIPANEVDVCTGVLQWLTLNMNTLATSHTIPKTSSLCAIKQLILYDSRFVYPYFDCMWLIFSFSFISRNKLRKLQIWCTCTYTTYTASLKHRLVTFNQSLISSYEVLLNTKKKKKKLGAGSFTNASFVEYLCSVIIAYCVLLGFPALLGPSRTSLAHVYCKIEIEIIFILSAVNLD